MPIQTLLRTLPTRRGWLRSIDLRRVTFSKFGVFIERQCNVEMDVETLKSRYVPLHGRSDVYRPLRGDVVYACWGGTLRIQRRRDREGVTVPDLKLPVEHEFVIRLGMHPAALLTNLTRAAMLFVTVTN